jgi:anaphase-promoting complex subunit 1
VQKGTMATIRSLGIHEPAALPYLIAEGILPPDPPRSLYTWRVDAVALDSTTEAIEEEVLATDTCAVWSRAGVVKRVYNLDIEGEQVLQAFTTWFPRTRRDSTYKKPHGKVIQKSDTVTKDGPPIFEDVPAAGAHSSAQAVPSKPPERALVVVLKSQVHVFLLSGDSHVIPLSFEAEAAFPAPQGFLIQRRLAKNELGGQGTQTQSSPRVVDTSLHSLPSSLQGLLVSQPKQTEVKPRLFCFSEVLDEIGLVVVQTAEKTRRNVLDPGHSSPLSTDEDLVYISSRDELGKMAEDSDCPLCLVVTQNRHSYNLTLWHATYLTPGDSEPRPKRRKLVSNAYVGKRKSSNVFGMNTGAATPNGTFQTRESFGALAQPFSENVPNASKDDLKAPQSIDLEAQLGQEFGQVGVQTRSARRISSMLARTDLMTGHDRTMFTDIMQGHPNRKSMNRTTHRGESIGSFGDRQSFGRRRSSFPTNASVKSNGTSFLEVPGAQFSADTGAYEDLQEMIDNGFPDLNSGTPPQVALTRIKSLPRSSSTSSQTEPVPRLLEIFTLLTPRQQESGGTGNRQITLCIMDKLTKELALVNLKVYQRQNQKDSKPDPGAFKLTPYVKGTEVRRGSNIIDACKVWSGNESRILILTQTRNQSNTLRLEAPWTSPFRIDFPSSLTVYNPTGIPGIASPDRRKETGQHRVFKASEITIGTLESGGAPGEILMTDAGGQKHRMLLQLSPTDHIVERILDICRFVLPGSDDGGLILAWWEVMRWLQSQKLSVNVEYTALVVVIFAMALPFVTSKSGSVPSTPRKKKGGVLRSSSGTVVDMSSWDAMVKVECLSDQPPWMTADSWSWASTDAPSTSTSSKPKAHRPQDSVFGAIDPANANHKFIPDCISYARDFLQSPAGETAIGPEGYLPTAMNKDRELRRNALPAILVSLHLYREELKLQTRSSGAFALRSLGPVIAQLGQWLEWTTWTQHEGNYYHTEIENVDQWVFESTKISTLEMPGQPFDPPSIFMHVDQCVANTESKAFLSLLDVAGRPDLRSVSDEWYSSAAKLTPRLFALTKLLESESVSQWTARRFVDCGIDRSMVRTMPEGIAEALHKVIARQSSTIGPSPSKQMLKLLDRDYLDEEGSTATQTSTTKLTQSSSHDAIRDYHGIGNIALETDNIHSWDATSEADRQGVTRLIFREDRRYQEASKLVNQTRPPMVDCTPEPEWTEGDLLDAQKELASLVAHRTLSVASGRGMMHFNARVPLVTERVPIPAFSLQCVMKPRVDGEGSALMTFSADKATFTEDKACWAFFHNGSSAGLMISKDAKGIDTSWILYNKPPELTNRHAGFLLALGLTGHLKNLAKWVAFKYLTPKHTMTSIGLLLGLSASYLGTMDSQITRLLSVHVTCLLPPGAAELNLSPLTQATSIMGIGLLYHGSQHRRMSEIMLSEIENNDPEEGVAEESLLRDEGYRLSAGFALGYINLGQGKRLHSLHDMGVVERLLAVAISTKNVNLVHVLDRATAGATVAIALIFMKTNDESIARKIDIPDTIHQFDYVRPDIFLLRTVARHLIMWDSIEPTPTFVKKSLPPTFRHRSTLKLTKHLSTEDMPFFNITAGICLALGLRFAGSGLMSVRDLLVSYLDQFIRLTRLPAPNYDTKLTRNSVRNCQDVVALAAAAVMAGTGDLVVLRRLRSLHGRVDKDTPYGSHLAAHMAIGGLFLGGGTYTFGTSNLAVASLLCAFYPLFPTSVLDNKSHLQAFRHLWALAAEPRCVVCKDSEGGKVISASVEVVMKSGEIRSLTTPCLLPELSEVKSLKSHEQEYWHVNIELSDESARRKFMQGGLTIMLRRRAAYDAPAKDLFVSELQALSEQGPAPSVNTTANAATFRPGMKSNENPFEWLFSLQSLVDLDVSERALVLPPNSVGIDGRDKLLGTVIDARLELENILSGKSASKDQLWQLRLLFAWSDRWGMEKVSEAFSDEEDANGNLRQEVIDRLKWRVWQMTQ